MAGGSGGRRPGEEDETDTGGWAVARYLVGTVIVSIVGGLVLKLLGF